MYNYDIYNYEFYGRIIPEGLNLGFKTDRVVKVSNDKFGIYGSVTFECAKSIANVIFTTDRIYSEDLLPTIRNIVCEYGKLIINFYCYLRSINCELDIQRVRCKELDIDRKFSIQLETNIKTDAQEIGLRIDKILSLISEDKKLFLLLGDVFADFRRAIQEVKMSGAFFYRAVETVRRYFENPSENNTDKRRSDGWEKMNSALEVNQSFYRDLLRFATPNRHGEYPSITGEERIKLAKDTRHIIEKFINYIEKI